MQGKVAIVTGGGSGIGEGIVRRLGLCPELSILERIERFDNRFLVGVAIQCPDAIACLGAELDGG